MKLMGYRDLRPRRSPLRPVVSGPRWLTKYGSYFVNQPLFSKKKKTLSPGPWLTKFGSNFVNQVGPSKGPLQGSQSEDTHIRSYCLTFLMGVTFRVNVYTDYLAGLQNCLAGPFWTDTVGGLQERLPVIIVRGTLQLIE